MIGIKKLFARIIAVVLCSGLLAEMIPLSLQVQAASGVSKKEYSLSKKAGKYVGAVSVTVKAKKGYKVYYTTTKKLSTKKLIKSKKSKKFTFKKTTTLRIYGVKQKTKLSQKKLNKKKSKTYKYTITAPKPSYPTKETFGSETSGTPVSDMDAPEKSVDVSKSAETVITANAVSPTKGDQKVEVILPAETFEKDTKVTLKVVDGRIDIQKEGTDFCRLGQLATVRIPLNEIPKENELDFYKAAYYYGKKTYFIDPDRDKLRQGILEFQTGHFSWFGSAKLTEAEMRRRIANKQAVDEVTLEFKQKVIQSAINDMTGDSLKALGITEGSKAYTAVTRALSQSTEVYNLIQASKEGNYNTAMQKIAEISINTLAENPEYLSMTKINVTASAAANSITLLQALKTGDSKLYKEASVGFLKTFSGNIPAVKYGRAAVALWETGVDWITDDEMQTAYQLFRGEVTYGEHGFSYKNDGSGMVGWDKVVMYMDTSINQKVINYCKADPSKYYTDYTPEEKAKIRSQIVDQLKKNFENRYAQEKEIAKNQAIKEDRLRDLNAEKLLDMDLWGQYCGGDYELLCTRMLKIYDNILEMVGQENYKLLGYNDNMKASAMRGLMREFVEASWERGEGALGGRAAVAKRMAEKYGVDIDDLNVALSQTDISINGIGKTAEITLDGAGSSSTTWSSSNTSVARVKVSGTDHNSATITAVGSGTCRVFARHGGKTYQCWVNVVNGTEMENIELYVMESHWVNLPKGWSDGIKGDTNLNWKCVGNISFESSSSGPGEGFVIAGDQAGQAQLVATAGPPEDLRVFVWNVTIKPVTMHLQVGVGQDVDREFDITSEESGKMIDIDLDQIEYYGDTNPNYTINTYFLNVYVDGVSGRSMNHAEEPITWEFDSSMFYPGPMADAPENVTDYAGYVTWDRTLSFRQRIKYVGTTALTMKLPERGISISCNIHIRKTPIVSMEKYEQDQFYYTRRLLLDGIKDDADVSWYMEEGGEYVQIKYTNHNICAFEYTDAMSDWAYDWQNDKASDHNVTIVAFYDGKRAKFETSLSWLYWQQYVDL